MQKEFDNTDPRKGDERALVKLLEVLDALGDDEQLGQAPDEPIWDLERAEAELRARLGLPPATGPSTDGDPASDQP
ncbi:hypothetical protein [Streptosporangium sp. NPDC000396]|uniref:hypothetical protein n=1 Tax=Streptosporangium sp. NPDC000396 TaxID=3366185 RepID=UPI0036961DC7